MIRTTPVLAAALALGAAIGCGPPALTQQLEAGRVAAHLHVQFTKASDAANRAVMSESDEAAAKAVQDARDAAAAVDRDVEQLRRLLAALDFDDEARMLEAFAVQYADYKQLDVEILPLALENSNVKAERLSFGPAREATETFRRSVDAAAAATDAVNRWHGRALAAEASAALLDILALQGPHIAAAEDTAMTGLEQRMAASDVQVQQAFDELKRLTGTRAVPPLTAAATALDQFRATTKQVIALSRRNSDVRSLDLSLGKKTMVAAASDAQLRALEEALATRSLGGTR